MNKLFKKGLIALTLMLGMTFAAPQNASAHSWYAKGDCLHKRDINHEDDFGLVTDIFFFNVDDGYDMLVIYSDGTWKWHRYWG